MPEAHELDERVSFQRRALDAHNRRLGDWAEEFARFCKLTWLRGGEPVLQSRLQGVQPLVLTVREDDQVRAVDPSWRIVGVTPRILDKVFDLKSPPARAKDFGFLDILAEFDGGPGGPGSS